MPQAAMPHGLEVPRGQGMLPSEGNGSVDRGFGRGNARFAELRQTVPPRGSRCLRDEGYVVEGMRLERPVAGLQLSGSSAMRDMFRKGREFSGSLRGCNCPVPAY